MQLQSGHTLQEGKYIITKVLGQGGFGITYEAEQVNIGRRVAIKEFFMKDCCERSNNASKVIVPTLNNKDLVNKFKDKFVREAKLIASFNHENIVRILDVFEENDTAYYVMENLPGGSLLEKVKRCGRLTEEEAERFIRQIAGALSYIHAHNTVHLDIKPSNILLNSKGQAVLIDFGISKHYDEAGEQTTTSPVGYSPGYSPLEQSRVGDVSQFKPTTDIYALGATLYYLVTGITPPDASVVYEVGLERPNGISDRIWQTISNSMRGKRAERPQNIQSFLAILDSEESTVLNHQEPARTNNTPTNNKNKRWRGALLGVLSCVLVVLLLNLILKSRSNNQEPHITSGYINGHEWVDLGLSVKWATCNVGALSPEDYGDYFAWGETVSKDLFTMKNYKYYLRGDLDDSPVCFSKYVVSTSTGVSGTIDNKVRLDYSDDAANVNWGGTWRMASISEWDELIMNCKWTWVNLPNKIGYEIVSNINGASIFLPASGTITGAKLENLGDVADYWSSNLSEDFPLDAWFVIFSSTFVDKMPAYRYFGRTVRPVCK